MENLTLTERRKPISIYCIRYCLLYYTAHLNKHKVLYFKSDMVKKKTLKVTNLVLQRSLDVTDWVDELKIDTSSRSVVAM